MIKINLLDDIKAKPVPSEHRELSEQDHKQLVTTANKGVGAIRELKKHYGDLTIVNDQFGSTDLNDLPDDVEELSFEIKK
jgi:hypothetical protein